jgi:photosystem II stability/assembly factor-like uncharacterized protein
LLFLAIAANAEAQWEIQSALPTDRSLLGVAFHDPLNGLVVGENRHLLRTTDGGASWLTILGSDFGTDPFYAVAFPDPLHGYITGNNNDAWRSTDGGVTWIQMTTIPAGSWSHLDFLTPTAGFAGANGACCATTNGGVNWVLRSGYPDCPIMYSMDFRDSQVGLVGGYHAGLQQNGIWKTNDGGTTWVRKHPSSSNAVIWISAQTAVASIGTGIYRSTDAGESWSFFAGGITSGLIAMARAGETILVGVSVKGDIWRSSDSGATWSFVFDGLGDLPDSWGVSFSDAQHGWVVGHHGIMLETADGGLTWSLRNSGSSVQIYELQMRDPSFGLAACNNGYLLRTTNGGAFWETQKLEVTGQIFGRDESLHSLSIVDASVAVVAGPGGTVFRTDNGGVDWTSIGYPVLPDLLWIEDVEFANANLGWVVGLDLDLGHDHTIYRTTDGGASWSPNLLAGGYMFWVDFVDASRGWIGSAGRGYYRTTNGGASWTPGTLPTYFTNPTVSDGEFADAQTGWVAGWDGYLAKTTDGGASWFLQDLGTTQDHLFDLSVVSAAEAWISGREQGTDRGFVYHTTNGGTNWSKQILADYPYGPYSVSGLPSGSVWTGGYAGRILHDRGQSADVLTIATAGNGPALTGSPNPFRTDSALRYVIPEAGRVRLEVFDAGGRRVATLADGQQDAGAHESLWRPDRSRTGSQALPSGVYFARLEWVGRSGSTSVVTRRIERVR